MEMKYCQSCGMPLADKAMFGTEKNGSINEDYCIFCYKDGNFTNDYTMDEMIEHCAQFVGEFNKDSETKLTKEEAIGQMKASFPKLKRWRKTLEVGEAGEFMAPGISHVPSLIVHLCDTLPITYIASVDDEGYPYMKAMLSPRKRDGVKVFYFTTNTFSLRVAQYRSNPKASIYFCDEKGFQAVMLKGTMEVLTDEASKEMIWREGDTEYYPGGVTDPNYCVLKFTAIEGRFYSDYYPRTFVL